MLSASAATKRFIASGNRLPRLHRLLDYWRFLNSPTVPERFLVDLFPETRGQTFAVSTDVHHHFELPYGERLVLAAIVRALAPKTVFEFGTYTGSTTLLIADACPPDAVVHTLDLPAAELEGTSVSDSDVGQRFRGKPQYDGRIVQHRANSRAFDVSGFRKRVDLVYIDASHKFEDVLHDSRLGLSMVAEGGVLIWDDYHVNSIPVAEALDVIAREVPVARIFHTRIAVHRQEAGART